MAQQDSKSNGDKKNGAGASTVGSTWPDVGRDFIKNLGSSIPWVIMLAALGYGFFVFQEWSVKNDKIIQEAQAKAMSLYGDQLKISSKALLDNYAEIQKSTTRQIQNVDGILDVNTKLVNQFKILQEETINALTSRREIEREADEVRRKKQQLETDVAILEGRLKVAAEEAKRQKEIAANAQQAQEVALSARETAQDLVAEAKKEAQEHNLRKMALEAKLATLDKQFSAATGDANTARAQLDLAKKETARAVAEAAKARNETAIALERTAIANAKTATAQKALEKAESETEKAKIETDEAKQETTRAVAEAATTRNEAALALNRTDIAKAKAEAAQKQLAEAKSQAEEAKAETLEAEEEAAKAWDEVALAEKAAILVQLEVKATASEAAKTKANVERLNEVIRRGKKQITASREELQKVQLALRAADKELDDKKKDLKRISKGTESSLDERDEWRGRLKKVVELLHNKKTSDATVLADNFFNEHFATPDDKVFSQRLEILKAFAANSTDDMSRTLDVFVGIHNDDFAKLIENGAGFSQWIRFGNETVGVVAKGNGPSVGIAVFTTSEERIIDVYFLTNFSSVLASRVNNWYEPVAYRLFIEDGDFRAFERANDLADEESWSVTYDRETILFGSFRKMPKMNINELDRYYQESMYGQSVGSTKEFLYFLDMYRRSGDFRPSPITVPRMDLLSDDLKDSFAGLLVGAVRNDAEGLQRVVDPFLGFGDMGKIAAVALKPEFQVIDVRQLEAIHQQQPSRSNIIEVITMHRTLEGKDEKTSFVFEKTVTGESYMLKKFSIPYLEVSSQLQQ